MSGMEAYGYAGAAVAVVFFGSNYVPVKKYPTGDGMIFQWIMCNGILVVGFIAMAISGTWDLHWEGLLGGAIWALGNLMVVPIINILGLGLGMLLWSSSNLIIPYFLGRFGAFGMPPEVVPHPIFSIIGVVLGSVSLVINFFIKPDVETGKDGPGYETIDETAVINIARQPQSMSLSIRKAIFGKRTLGIFMALLAGTLYAFNLVPFRLWAQGKTPGPLDFVISQFSGIFLMSTLATIIYMAFKCGRRTLPETFPQTLLPAFISGVLWAVACSGQLVATQELGFSVGYPMVAIGPMLVSTFWSVVVFKEIRGLRNLLILGASLVCTIVGVVMFLLARLG